MTGTSWSGEARYRAILAVAAAANEHLDLFALLDAVASALEELVPVDIVGVVGRDGEGVRPLGIHWRADPRRSDEHGQAYLDRVVTSTAARAQVLQEMRTTLDLVEREGSAVVIDDLLSGVPMEMPDLVKRGVRTLVHLPLVTRAGFLGVLTFMRCVPRRFTTEEVSFLQDVSRPIGIAVANALAYEEVRKLRVRLEDENLALQEEIAANALMGGLIGQSSAMRKVLDRVVRVAATGATVLVTGETGTGKELIARAIHAGSPRAKRPLIKVNCAALPEGLVASELFGHERGAFTGALERRKGRFELASGGTIFLDEIGELPAPTQVALLRVLQEGEFERVGGTETLKTDARVVAATNRNLDEAVREGRFRSDLLFRLNVVPISVPPLRERAGDIPLVADYYTSQFARKIGKRIRGVSPRAMDALEAYPWPGNVRELQNLVERAVILTRHEFLEPDDFELPRLSPRSSGPQPSAPDDERKQIEEALRAARGRVAGVDGAAASLGVAPSTLEARIRRLGVDKFAFRPRRGN